MPKNIRAKPTGSFHLILTINEKAADSIRVISNRINNFCRSNFILDNKNYRPHITLYLFSAPLRNTNKIVEKVNFLSKNFAAAVVKIDKIILASNGWIMINVDNSGKDLLRYHKKAVKIINGLREGAMRKKYRDENYFNGLRRREKYNLLKYGDKHAMSDFHAHISLAQYDDQEKALEAFDKYKDSKLPKRLKITGIELVRAIGNESGGTGKILFSGQLRTGFKTVHIIQKKGFKIS